MATYTADQAASTYPTFGTGPAGSLKVAYGSITSTETLADNDVINVCKVPAGATVLGGYVLANDIDTGTEELDIDIGWLANDDEIADLDGFGNFGVWSGDPVTDLIPVAGNYKPLQGVLLTAGPKTFTAETTISLDVNTNAATQAASWTVTAVVFYVFNA